MLKKIVKITAKILLTLVIVLLIFSAVMYFTTKGEYSVPQTVADNPSLPHIEVGDVVFHAETFGNDSNETVVVLHGGPGNDYKYLLPLKDLASDYFVVFYDQRGTGLSPRVDASEQSLENSLNDLSNIINYYAPGKKVNLIGHSWGAMLASGYIAKNPERVNKAVLAEPGMLTTEKGKEFMQRFKVDMNWNVLKAFTTTAFESLHLENEGEQGRIDYILGKVGSIDSEGNPMKKYFCGESLANSHVPFWRLGGVASQAILKNGMDEEGVIQIDLVTGLENYTDKVLFITGECNQIIGTDFQKGHLSYFKNAELKEIKNAGHSMIGEKPEECLQVIRTYFEE